MIFSRQTTVKRAASSPAHLTADWLNYLAHFRGSRQRLWIHALLGASVLVIGLRWHFVWLLLPLPFISDFRHCLRLRQHCWQGEVNAAKVIRLEPPLIACFAELGFSVEASFPAIRIVQVPASALRKMSAGTGDNLAAICRLVGGSPGGRCDGFKPVPSVCCTRNPHEIERLNNLVPEWQLDAINEGLFQIPQPYRPGTYLIDLSFWHELVDF